MTQTWFCPDPENPKNPIHVKDQNNMFFWPRPGGRYSCAQAEALVAPLLHVACDLSFFCDDSGLGFTWTAVSPGKDSGAGLRPACEEFDMQ